MLIELLFNVFASCGDLLALSHPKLCTLVPVYQYSVNSESGSRDLTKVRASFEKRLF